jgi:hypothetical protein
VAGPPLPLNPRVPVPAKVVIGSLGGGGGGYGGGLRGGGLFFFGGGLFFFGGGELFFFGGGGGGGQTQAFLWRRQTPPLMDLSKTVQRGQPRDVWHFGRAVKDRPPN